MLVGRHNGPYQPFIVIGKLFNANMAQCPIVLAFEANGTYQISDGSKKTSLGYCKKDCKYRLISFQNKFWQKNCGADRGQW